jgi:RING-variant domain
LSPDTPHGVGYVDLSNNFRMSSYPFNSGSSWSWPNGEKLTPSGSAVPGAFSSAESEPAGTVPLYNDATDVPPKAQKHYASRTCRICLEVVSPTFEPAPEGLSGILHPPPRVIYISQDAESGRLIRPCKCKGTQRYVHEGCLQQWRYADPGFGRRNYFECPTCKFRYRLERMRWSRWISSTATQITLTILILFTTVFILGFVADPILSLYMDPLGTLTTNPLSRVETTVPISEDERATWWEHIWKGLASLGLLGVMKVIFTSPWQWYQLRNAGLLGGARPRNGRAGNGRDRFESISWYLIAVGVFTFLWVS